MNELYDNIDKDLNDVLSTKVSKKKNSLKKKQKTTITIVSKPITHHIKLNKEDMEKIKQKTLGKELIKFRKKVSKNFKSENLTLLNKNIKTLKVKIKYFAPEILLLKFASGKYKIIKNKIELIKYFKTGTTNHEFFHMATSFYFKEGKFAFCGFQQINYIEKESVGRGLNEGYTELLTNRYFKEQSKFVDYSYDVCNFFASKLEEIVGKERMENFYIKADLYGLYEYLLNFTDGPSIVTFITALDYLVNKADRCNIEKNERYYKMVELYLAKWFINKKKQELDKNIIDEKTYNHEIQNYIDSLENKDLYIENYVKQKEYCLK